MIEDPAFPAKGELAEPRNEPESDKAAPAPSSDHNPSRYCRRGLASWESPGSARHQPPSRQS